MSASLKPGEIVVLIWTCLHCRAKHEEKTTVLECELPGCQADTHSTWRECLKCGWETRLVRHHDDTIHSTHKRASEHGNGKVGRA